MDAFNPMELVAVYREAGGDGKRLMFVDWNLGNVCQYACSYCPKRLHDGSEPAISLDKAVAFSRWAANGAASQGCHLHFHFSGGEPTIYREFEPLIRLLHDEKIATVSMVSNGARPESWWRRVAPLFESVTLSCHVEYVNIDRFMTIAQALVELTVVHINIPAPPERFDDCVRLYDAIVTQIDGVTATLKPILKGFGEELADYSENQLLRLRSPGTAASRLSKSAIFKPLVFVDRAGVKSNGSASSLVAKNRNSFTGWECTAGIESLAVLLGGDIYRAVCKEGGKLGSLNGELGQFPGVPITCGKSKCKCLTDIPIRKQAHSGAVWMLPS